MRTSRHNPAVTSARNLTIVFLVACLLAVTFSTQVLAQGCAMCQTLMPHANEPMARGMFWSVLFLMSAPFTVAASIGGWLFYQYWSARRVQRTAAPILPLHLASVQKEG